MAYVELSRVRSLAGLHLSAFDPRSIFVSRNCFEEINWLRGAFRNDHRLYQTAPKTKASKKRKVTGSNSSAKKLKLADTKHNTKSLSKTLCTSPRKLKRSQPMKCDNVIPTKTLVYVLVTLAIGLCQVHVYSIQ